MTVQQLIQQYNLQPHPEGGWYKETYKSDEYISEVLCRNVLLAAGSFQQLFIFYWNREISPPFTALKAMSAGIFIQAIL